MSEWQNSPTPQGQPGGAPLSGPPSSPGQPIVTRNDGNAITVLVLGIASLVLLPTCIGFIPAIIALVMAPGARRTIPAGQASADTSGMITAGVVCSWITIGVSAAAVVLLILFALFFAAPLALPFVFMGLSG